MPDWLKPWIKVGIGGVTGGTVIVLGSLLAAMVIDMMDGTMGAWKAIIPTIGVMWLIGVLVCGTVYWMHSPKGREVWTDEQREAFNKATAKAGGPQV
jgi:hypothetical protein